MNNQKGFTLTELLVVLVMIGGVWGWVWNIVKLVSVDNIQLTGMIVGRVIGVFVPPLGAVLGFL
jgi:prepilin-type N-terminal cleavage/methylation domain-containing protein